MCILFLFPLDSSDVVVHKLRVHFANTNLHFHSFLCRSLLVESIPLRRHSRCCSLTIYRTIASQRLQLNSPRNCEVQRIPLLRNSRVYPNRIPILGSQPACTASSTFSVSFTRGSALVLLGVDEEVVDFDGNFLVCLVEVEGAGDSVA